MRPKWEPVMFLPNLSDSVMGLNKERMLDIRDIFIECSNLLSTSVKLIKIEDGYNLCVNLVHTQPIAFEGYYRMLVGIKESVIYLKGR